MSTLAVLPGIVVRDDGSAWIEGTRMMVTLIACEKNSGWSEKEIQEADPHLTLSQIHVALAYYYDHKTELDREIQERDRRVRAAEEAQRADPAFQTWKQALKDRSQALKGKAS